MLVVVVFMSTPLAHLPLLYVRRGVTLQHTYSCLPEPCRCYGGAACARMHAPAWRFGAPAILNDYSKAPGNRRMPGGGLYSLARAGGKYSCLPFA